MQGSGFRVGFRIQGLGFGLQAVEVQHFPKGHLFSFFPHLDTWHLGFGRQEPPGVTL